MGSGSAISIQLLLVGLGGARATAILMRFGLMGWDLGDLFRCRGRFPGCASGA
jgi:hypothetical protein